MNHKLDLLGRINNTQVPRSKPLLPLFEAVVNSFQAIEELGKDAKERRIEISVERSPILPEHGDGEIDGFRITDTGIGFTDANFDAFLTSDTRNKVLKGGKGVGRFSWLKVFEYAEIESHY